MSIPTSDTVTAAWLTEQLHRAGYTDTEVTGFNATQIGTGQIGKCVRYELQHSNPNTPDGKARTSVRWANFLHSQFGVNTLANYDWFRTMDTPDKAKQEGMLQRHTLKDNETLAQLATGVKRFPLPDDQNFIKIYQSLCSSHESAADRLIQIYV